MGVDMLRGGSGRSHFLVASFALLSLFLLFNWWSLSTENLDLLKQIEGVSQHLKSSSSLLDQCRHDRTALEGRVRRLEDDTQSLVEKLDSEKQKVSELESKVQESLNEASASQKKFDGTSSSLKMCKTELESLKNMDISKDGVIASMRIEKSDLSNQIQELKDQVSKLSRQLEESKQEKSIQNLPKKPTSSTSSLPSRLENEGGENEVRNIPEPIKAEEKDGEHNMEKEDQAQEDERELAMQDNGDERKGA